MVQITFSALNFCFPKDTMWIGAVAEIVGYSPSTNLHIVINDGCCISESWLVNVYEPNNPEEHKRDWTPTKERPYPIKHLSDEHAFSLVNEYVNFDSSAETIRLRNIIKTLPMQNKGDSYEDTEHI